MQTFLPSPDFVESARILDPRRLGKQRVEAMQILKAITNQPRLDGKPYKGWVNHPCSIMWRNYPEALKLYANCMIEEWVKRGYKNTMELFSIDKTILLPEWLGFEPLHSSHRSNLLKKESDFYQQYEWVEDTSLPYVWLDADGRWYEQIPGERTRNYL